VELSLRIVSVLSAADSLIILSESRNAFRIHIWSMVQANKPIDTVMANSVERHIGRRRVSVPVFGFLTTNEKDAF